VSRYCVHVVVQVTVFVGLLPSVILAARDVPPITLHAIAVTTCGRWYGVSSMTSPEIYGEDEALN